MSAPEPNPFRLREMVFIIGGAGIGYAFGEAAIGGIIGMLALWLFGLGEWWGYRHAGQEPERTTFGRVKLRDGDEVAAE